MKEIYLSIDAAKPCASAIFVAVLFFYRFRVTRVRGLVSFLAYSHHRAGNSSLMKQRNSLNLVPGIDAGKYGAKHAPQCTFLPL